MIVSQAKIDCSRINDWPSFHDEFDRVFGFPDFYGRNMDAWNDCMTSIDAPDEGMTSIHCPLGGVLTIELDNVDELTGDRAEFLDAIVDGVAFVNFRRIDVGEQPVLSLSYFKRAR